MNFLQFALILKARYKIILATFVLLVTSTILVSLILPKTYTATTSVILNYKGMDPVTGMVLPAQLMPGYMATQVDILQSRKVAAKVSEKLGLDKSPQAQELFQSEAESQGNINNWLGDLLLKKLNVKPSKESSVIEISFTGSEPNFAAAIANSFAETYIQTNILLKIEPAQKAAGYFVGQIKALRESLEQAQNKLANYQQDKGFTSVDDRLDVETNRLNELSTQLSIAQAQAIDSMTRQTNAQLNANSSPDISQNPLIQNLRLDLSRSQSRLSELAQRLSKNHPQYMAAEAELQQIKSQLNAEMLRASSNITSSAKINQQRESELRAQVQLQKQKVLLLNRQRSEFIVLQKDVETAQRAFDTVTQRLSQSTLEGQSNQSDIAILNPATAPMRPSSPRIVLNTLIASFLSVILGLGLALIYEMIDRRVRSKEDLMDILQVPVFAVIEAKVIKRNFGLLLLK